MLLILSQSCGTRQPIQRHNIEGEWQVQNSKCEEFYHFYSGNHFNHFSFCYTRFRKLDTRASFVRRGIFTKNSDTATLTYTDRDKEDDKIVYLYFRSGTRVVTLTNLENHKALVLKRVRCIPKIKTTLNQGN